MTRGQTWLALIVVGVGMLVAGILGLFAYMSATATPLHPDPQSVPSATASALSPEWVGAIERGRQLVRVGITDQNLPGVSVAVGAGGEIVWAEGFGWSNIDSRVPIAPNTRFRIGAASIPITSAAVGLLLEKNRLKLDEEIRTYVSAFPQKQWPVTLGQLMGHVAGIRGGRGDEEPLSARCERPADALDRFAESPLRFEPGTQFRFTPYGWILVSAAVEAAADERFFRFMRTQIFEPLGMHDTTVDSATELIPAAATFYYPRFAGDPRYGPDPAREGDYSCFAGAGAFLSTPSDLVRFGLALTGGKLLQPATLTMLQSPQRLASGQETGYALGWDLESVSLAGRSAAQVGHDGEFFIGGSSSLITFPDRGLVVVVMTNTSFADMSALALKVAEAFAEREKSPRAADRTRALGESRGAEQR
jgi:CubicO group peptidase (beta-lactamase class C family)